LRLRHVWLTDFRNYQGAELDLAGGLTVVVGGNGAGKTNLLEAIGYLATLASFRGAPADAMVRQGCERAVVRGQGERQGRDLLVEAEIARTGRGRVAVNRQPLRRSADLLGALRATVFSPDDLELVKGGPSARRRYLDDALVGIHPRNDALRREVERIVRQRTTLLRQAGGRLTPDVAATLDVWDAKLVEAGEALAAARAELVDRLRPALARSYAQVAQGSGRTTVSATYEALWRHTGLATALEAARVEELRRGMSLVGPHRDDLTLSVSGMPARTHASQGEQRSLALALRLAAHAVLGEAVGEPPFLLLDDVFSELDAARSRALLDHLAATSFGHVAGGQAVLTTAESLPAGAEPELVVRITEGRIG
jgi:DNA replication and repair protein RecF